MINLEKRNEFAKALIDAYYNGIFKIVWSVSGFSIAIDSKRKELLPEVKEEEFVDYAFSIIKMVINLAENKDIEKYEECDFEIAKKIYENEYDLKNHLCVKKNSKMECFKLLEYEIISHRNAENPVNIEVNSIIIKVMTEKDDDENAYSFELSRRDLEDIIDRLIEIREKMNIL